MKDDIVIVGAARTPVGAFNGAFANLAAHELGKTAITGALAAVPFLGYVAVAALAMELLVKGAPMPALFWTILSPHSTMFTELPSL